MRISQGQYGAQAAMPRIRALFDRHGVRASFFYPAVSALRPYTPPSAVEEIFAAEFEGAYEEEGGLFLLTMHPHVIDHRSRRPLLERRIARMKARPGVWFGTHEEVARWCASEASPPVAR